MLGNYNRNDSSNNNDEDDDDVRIVNNYNKLELDSNLLLSTSQIDYQDLYLKELQKNIELEHIIQNLHFELSLHKEKLETNDIIYNDVFESTSLVRVSDNENYNNDPKIITTSEWNKLEKEEKDRRQKQRYVRVKSQKKINNNITIDQITNSFCIHPNSIPDSNNNISDMLVKDYNMFPLVSLHSQQKQDVTNNSQFNNSSNTTDTNINKPNTSWQWEADDSEEEIAFSPPLPDRDATLPSTNKVMNTTTTTNCDIIINEGERVTSQKELAAIERQRRVQNMRRNVRNSNARRLQQQPPQTNRSISPIPITTIPTKPTTAISSETFLSYDTNNSSNSFANKHKYKDSSESDDWDSSDKEEIRYTTNNTNSKDIRSLSINSNNNIMHSNNTCIDVEQQLDFRIKEWVRGKDIAAMLRSISVVSLANREMFEDKGIYTAVDGMSNDPIDIRKIYLKVIRHCHPDKQTHLDSEGKQFLELKKIFTVLSDTYNRYKADMAV